MNAVQAALTESIWHAILTVELALGVLTGSVFIGLYLRRQWWASQAGRLAMGNMVALTLLAAAGLLYRLGMQVPAITLLIPVSAAVLAVQVWWVRQLIAAGRE